MNLIWYSGDTEQDIRKELDAMADYVIQLQNQSAKEGVDVEIENRNKVTVKRTIKDMSKMVCGLYLKNPDSNFYGKFLQETATLKDALKKSKSEIELGKLSILGAAIRRGRWLALQTTPIEASEF